MNRSQLLLTVALLLAPSVALTQPSGQESARVDLLEKRIRILEKQLARYAPDVSGQALPDEIDFCGVPVDLDDPIIRERIEREFFLVLGNRAQVVLWAKRAARVFPTVVKQAKKLDVCDDLKYVAVIESGLRPKVTSRASARGWWQFMGPTGKDFGLTVDGEWDQRADLEKSTHAGLSYLKRLEARFGSWPLAMAAYNTGPNRLDRAMTRQGESDFWDLRLYAEAERYVPRTIAIKLVMENPQAYGFQFRVRDAWPEEPRSAVSVKVPSGLSVSSLTVAKAAGINYRRFRRLNPELGEDSLPAGRRVAIKVAPGEEKAIEKAIKGEIKRARRVAKRRAADISRKKKAAAAKAAKERRLARARKAKAKKARAKKARKTRRYTVRSGDSLWSIANRHSISVGELQAWNKLGGSKVLQPGDRLIVARRR